LTQLSGCELHLTKRASIGPIDSFSKFNRVGRHAHAVTARHGISSFNRRHAGIDKALNEPFLFIKQKTVFNSKGSLARDDRKKPFVFSIEIRQRRPGLWIKRRAVGREFIQELYNAYEIATWRDQRSGKYVSRLVVQTIAHLP